VTLSERLDELIRAKKPIRSPRPIQRLLIEQSYDRITKQYENINPSEGVNYDLLLAKLRTAANSHSISNLTPREMRLAASCLFDGREPFANNPSFLSQYLDALRSIRSRMAIKRLIHTYCLHFDPTHPGLRQIASFLQAAVSTIQARWKWLEVGRQYSFFDPTQAPRQLAKLTTDAAHPRTELEKVGLSGQLSAGGLSAHIFVHALKIIQAKLEKNPQMEDIERAIAWVQADDGKMYFRAYRGALANALLLPFVNGDPAPNIRDRIQSYLLERMSDPRIDRGAWLGTDESASSVMIRWLAQATLEQFLKVVDHVAPKHQWDYRRVFWNAYIRKGMVANAWVAFGSNGAHVARRIAEATADELMRRFATLLGGSSNHAVLLLSIGDLVIADWSHSGRLRIWRSGNNAAPKFGRPSYSAKDLRAGSDFDAVHNPPDSWQKRAETYIRRNTGISLSETEYMPMRR
jgi:hypothetical protein